MGRLFDLAPFGAANDFGPTVCYQDGPSNTWFEWHLIPAHPAIIPGMFRHHPIISLKMTWVEQAPRNAVAGVVMVIPFRNSREFEWHLTKQKAGCGLGSGTHVDDEKTLQTIRL